MNYKFYLGTFWLIFFYLIIRATNQIFFKFVAISSANYWAVANNPLFYVCCLLFALQAFVWIKVLQSMPLSRAYPFTSLIFVFILISGSIFFSEPIDLGHIIGTMIIMVGVIITAVEGRHSPEKNAHSRHAS